MGLLALCGPFAACLASQASAVPVETSAPKGRETGLPVSRFVSLKSANARMRIGPSLDYGTKWIYVKSGLPLEITAEYDNWRQVRDSDGITGWMHRALLSSRRTAVIGPWLKQAAALHTGAREEFHTVAFKGAHNQMQRLFASDSDVVLNVFDGRGCNARSLGQIGLAPVK